MSTINTTCPACSAPFAKKLSLVYKEGISSVNMDSHSVGVTNTIGKVKVTTSGSSVGIQQSALSQSAAPPHIPPIETAGSKRKVALAIGGPIASIVLPLLISALLGVHLSFGVYLLIMFISLATTLGLAAAINDDPTKDEQDEYNRRTRNEQRAYQEWDQTYACGACGHRFIPKEQIPAPPMA